MVWRSSDGAGRWSGTPRHLCCSAGSQGKPLSGRQVPAFSVQEQEQRKPVDKTPYLALLYRDSLPCSECSHAVREGFGAACNVF